jgi:prepilin-type N-terminal cleavage/methylation domain-containing protein
MRSVFRRNEGFTLVEVLIAMTVLLVGVLGTLAVIDRANATTVTTRSREAAVNLAREVIEGARGVPYVKLTPASIESEIQTLPALTDDGDAAGWTIRRRGFTYTVTATVCSFDDARDGGGDHSTGSFCADGAALSTPADRNPEDYRRVRVDVTWTDRGQAREVHQTELVNNPGSAGAPAVRTLVLGSGATTTNGHVTGTSYPYELTFDLTTSSPPHTLHWLLDGASQAPITTGGGVNWSFRWPVGQPDAVGSVVDGTYVLSAEAFDQYGVAGASRSLTVVLNRTPADKVTGLGGGRTGDLGAPEAQVVDLEWLPTPERDIVGYTVERWDSGSGTWAIVCPRADRDSCIDGDPPVEDNLRYRVFAWDIDPGGQPRQAPVPSDELVVRLGNNPPFAPLDVTARAVTGAVELSWTRPPVDDVDSGDSIVFYRIYRDGTVYDARYAVWDDPGASVTFIDGNTGGTPHQYWVTAVDENFAESVAVPATVVP